MPNAKMPARAGLPGEWLSVFSASARDAGLANANGALGGAASVYSNPAGLAQSNLGEAYFMTAPLLLGGQYQALSLAHPLAPRRYLGAGLIYLSSGRAERTNEFGENQGSFKEGKLASIISFGEGLTPSFNMGFNLKIISQSLAEYSDTGLGLDAGLQFQSETGYPVLGFTFQNLAAPSIRLRQEKEKWPLALKSGLSHLLRWGPRSLLLTAGAVLIDPAKKGRRVDYATGLELRPLAGANPLFLRFGVNRREFSLGFGLQAGALGFDYAVVLQNLATLHRAGIAFKYGYLPPLAQKRLEREWQKIREQQQTWRLAGKDAPKTDDQKQNNAAAFEEKLSQLNGLKKEGRLDKAESLLHELEKINPDDARLINLVQELQAVRLAERFKTELDQAHVYYGAKLYEKTLQAAEKALVYDPHDEQARILRLLAKTQIALTEKNYEEAQKQLRTIVEINPDHEEAIRLYRQIQNILEINHDKK